MRRGRPGSGRPVRGRLSREGSLSVLFLGSLPPQPGLTGLLFPVGDVQALAGLIEAGAADAGLRGRFGAAARAAAEATPTSDRIAAYERALREAIDVHRRTRLRRADAAG